MNFKVGEKVRIKQNLDTKTTYYMLDEKQQRIPNQFNDFAEPMGQYCGKITTIESVHSQYTLKNCGGWSWTDEMLDRVEPKFKPLRKRVKSLREIDKDIQQLQKQIKELQEYKQIRFNEKTLVLEIHEDTALNLNFEIFDKDINESMFEKTRKSVITVYRHKNKIEVNISTPKVSGTGIARCHKDDEFNYVSGIALALHRANINIHLNMEKNLLRQI